MLQPQDTTETGGPPYPARPYSSPQARVGRRRFVDRLARASVSLGGIVIILSILAILLVIVIEIAPLFRGASASAGARIALKGGAVPMVIGLEDYREFLYTVDAEGIQVWRASDGTPVRLPPVDLAGASVTAVSDRGRGALALGLSDGHVQLAEIGFPISYTKAEGRRVITPDVKEKGRLTANPGGGAVRILAHAFSDQGLTVAAALGPREIALVSARRKKALVGEGKLEESLTRIEIRSEGEIRVLALDGHGEDLFAGTSKGELVRVDVRDPDAPRLAEVRTGATREGSAYSVLGFLLGDRTLVSGDASGGVRSWQILRVGGADPALTLIHDFKPHLLGVVALCSSRRDKGFLTAGSDGSVHLHYGTTGETLAALDAKGAALRAASLAPRGDGVAAIGEKKDVQFWSVDNPHPEATLRSLFGKVWYEGYPKPDYVWQSTGTDDFESKLSLTPLLFGTLKGTFYALLMAVPLALLSALYVSQFMHPKVKGTVKPLVEVMAALPSVVLGFIAGLWLAPHVNRAAPGLFLAPLVTAILILLALAGWRMLPLGVRRHLKPGVEICLLIPIVLAGFFVSMKVGAWAEAGLLGGDYQSWLHRLFTITVDQRNSLVVGFAMGFAVIPIIFTIAEDALSNVPSHLSAGSLALGATRWQTALRVVLPTASPGIFSAVMIGFGRAVGETMIVVMATGNTPIMNLSPFNGFCTLTAKVAVELPEAPVGSTLFRVLFLAAFLLFVMTFIVNTLAEVIRLRLRRRYQFL